MALVPFGKIDRLLNIDGVAWEKIDDVKSDISGFTGVVADLRADMPSEWERFIAIAALRGVPVFHAKEAWENLTGRVDIEHLSENTLGSLIPNRAYAEIKYVVDTATAAMAIVLLGPLLLLIAALIKMDSPGPALFIQKRRGFRGRDFNIYKFRTMYVPGSGPSGEDTGNVAPDDDALRISHAVTKHRDIRVTRVGRFLRRTRLDELPQIINIVRGEMSWIGPRPEVIVLSERYEYHLPFYAYRHIVRPGITGWAQVNQGHVAEIHEVNTKLHYDFYYIKNFSIWIDMVICAQTIRILITGFGHR